MFRNPYAGADTCTGEGWDLESSPPPFSIVFIAFPCFLISSHIPSFNVKTLDLVGLVQLFGIVAALC